MQELSRKLLSFTHKNTVFRGGTKRKRDENGELEKLAFRQHTQNVKDIFNEEYESFKQKVVNLRNKYNNGRELPTRSQIIKYNINMKSFIDYAQEYKQAYADGISALLKRFPILPNTTCEYIQKNMMESFEKDVIRQLQNDRSPLMDFSTENEANPAMVIKNHAFFISLVEDGKNKIVYQTIGGHDFTDYTTMKYFLRVWKDPTEDTDLDTPKDTWKYNYFIPLTHFLTYYPYLVNSNLNNGGIQWITYLGEEKMNDMITKVFTDTPFDETDQEF